MSLVSPELEVSVRHGLSAEYVDAQARPKAVGYSPDDGREVATPRADDKARVPPSS